MTEKRQYVKLVVDGKVLLVDQKHNIPESLHDLKILCGIKLKKATYKERLKFLKKQKN